VPIYLKVRYTTEAKFANGVEKKSNYQHHFHDDDHQIDFFLSIKRLWLLNKLYAQL
jgi:hypothetical protein